MKNQEKLPKNSKAKTSNHIWKYESYTKNISKPKENTKTKHPKWPILNKKKKLFSIMWKKAFTTSQKFLLKG
jgi:hypothetical protein